MIGGFYGLDYPYGSRTIAPDRDSVSKCLLVVGGSRAQPLGYLTEKLRVCPTSGWAISWFFFSLYV